MRKPTKLTPAQQRAVDELRAWGRPFRAWAPTYMGRFGTYPAHFSECAEDYAHRADFKVTMTWATYEALVKKGVIRVIGTFKADATGRVAWYAELAPITEDSTDA